MAPSALYNHCERIFKRMQDESVNETIDDHSVQVWVGYTTKMFEEEKLATPQYTFVMQKLLSMGCVVQLHRGGGGGPSKWLLVTYPTRTLFDNSLDRPRGRPSTRDIEDQRYRDLRSTLQSQNERITTLEDWVAKYWEEHQNG